MSAEEEIEEEKMALEAIYGPALSETGCTVELDEFTISWTLPADYPEAPAEFSLSLVEDHDFHEQVMEHIRQTALESVGMAMIFTVISSVPDHLESLRQARIDEAERIKAEAERVEEEKRNTGTPCTVDNFNKWRKAFLVEMHGTDDLEAIFDAKDDERLTGRQIFARKRSGGAGDDEEPEPEELDQVPGIENMQLVDTVADDDDFVPVASTFKIEDLDE
ncbi:MAG: hypothetical protein SGCHY_005579 [Lobulomycetales sp.]